MLLTAVLILAPEGGFTALNPETGSTSQVATVAETIAKGEQHAPVAIAALGDAPEMAGAAERVLVGRETEQPS